MKICQDISQEMAKVQSVIDQFKELAEKVAKAGSKEETQELQREFDGLKAEKFVEYEKQQQMLTALSMNFQGELAKELRLEVGELKRKVKFDDEGYLKKLDVSYTYTNITNNDFSATHIVDLILTGNKGTKKLNFDYLPITLKKLHTNFTLFSNNSNIKEEIKEFFETKNQKVEIIS